MRYISTRNQAQTMTLSEAIEQGLAPDGGLLVPEMIPTVDLGHYSPEMSYPDFAFQLLQPFFKKDLLAHDLQEICQRTFNFNVPFKSLDKDYFVLELFHGPTASFKDFGARFLAECLSVHAEGCKTILVATSGDTGSAVASAFFKKKSYRIIILYPFEQVSITQERQMTCWGENIHAFAVEGCFDDCQRLVKMAFSDPYWRNAGGLSSANSINIGRLLPQITYYAYASVNFYQKTKQKPGFIVPTGNLGNATAAFFAKEMGFPIHDIVLATNANSVLSDYLETGHYQPRPSISTIANAMDVGAPSNLERLQYLFPDFNELKKNVCAIAVRDNQIRETIREIYQKYNYIICPHTATAFYVRDQLEQWPWIIVSTASPAKFDNIIKPLIHTPIPVPYQLQQLLKRPEHIIKIEANWNCIKERI